MATYAEEYCKSLDGVKKYARKYNDTGAAPLLRYLFEKHRAGEDTLPSLPVGLYAWAEDNSEPLAEHFRRSGPQRINTYDWQTTQRGPRRRYGDFTPLAMEQGMLVGAHPAGSEHQYNGANLTVLGVDPDAKGKTLSKPALTNLHRFLPYHWTAHYDRVPLLNLLHSLPEGSSLKPALAEYIHKHSLTPDDINAAYDRSNWTDTDYHRVVHENWPKDEYSHAYGQWLKQHGEHSLAEVVDRPTGYRRTEFLPRGYTMENEFVHRGVHIGVNRYPEDWDGDPSLHVTATIFHPDHDRTLPAYGSRFGRPGPRTNHIDFRKRFSGPQAQLWAQEFPEGEPREKATAAVKNAIEHPTDW